jgi:hypothetical protein
MTMVLSGRGEGKTLKQVEEEGMENPQSSGARGEGKSLKSERGREERETLKSMQAGRKERDQKSSGDGATKFAITDKRAITCT